MVYDIVVTIYNSPNKTTGWGYLIRANTKEEAVECALKFAQKKQTSRIQDLKDVLLV